MTLKLAILGRDNPYGSDPHYALYPLPKGATGWRLYSMFAEGRTLATGSRIAEELPKFSIQDYLRIERRNLVDGAWNARRGREAAAETLARWPGYDVIVLGRDVWSALGVPTTDPLTAHRATWPDGTGMNLHYLPHPSGRNLWYNQRGNRAAAARYLGRLYDFAWHEAVEVPRLHALYGIAPSSAASGRKKNT